jgi:hypothetical protein
MLSIQLACWFLRSLLLTVPAMPPQAPGTASATGGFFYGLIVVGSAKFVLGAAKFVCRSARLLARDTSSRCRFFPVLLVHRLLSLPGHRALRRTFLPELFLAWAEEESTRPPK